VKSIIAITLLCLCSGMAWAESEVYGYNVERLADAIYKAEGGSKTRYPYGILTKYKTTTPRQACINTIVNQGKRHASHSCGLDYLSCLAKRYAPDGGLKAGIVNDPSNLNRHWRGNVSRLYEKEV
jgi:hypothetical protein